jgi:hypothetical protein
VNLLNGANLNQTVSVTEGCFYELSFFALGEGANVDVEAVVTFITATGYSEGLRISVEMQDIPTAVRQFAYYRGITDAAPQGAFEAEIVFHVMAEGGQSLLLDDVSFSVS